MLISWVELQSHNVVFRGKNEAGAEQELLEMGRSE